ncbi:hypothetical protein MMC24_002282 [Lignoscripta atroalba]|nr:hypothetical protein [Lignoscripta atroalba]
MNSIESDDPHLTVTTVRHQHGPSHHVIAESTTAHQHAYSHDTKTSTDTPNPPAQIQTRKPNNPPTALQQHVSFWDRDNDNLITPYDVYTGFRELGFCVLFSLTALLINVFFSYPTRLGHSYLPDPYFRIYVDTIHKAKHGSDTGIYDSDGRLRPLLFDELFAKFDPSGTNSLGVSELFGLIKKDRVAADPAGWSFAFMEWSTTWLLLQRDGRVWKEDLRQCYDGSLFWRIRDDRLRGKGWRQGFGWREVFGSVSAVRDHVGGGDIS